jgi:hypothetical protein
MLSLSEIFDDETFGRFKRKLLFEDKLWCIYEKMPGGMDLKYHLIHRCHLRARAVSLRHDAPNSCVQCGCPPPDGILALAKLQRLGSGDHDGFNGELG